MNGELEIDRVGLVVRRLVGAVWVMVCFVLCAGTVSGQEEDPIDVQYRRVLQAIELANQPLEELSSSYVKQLEKLKEKAVMEGDLEKVLMIQEEIKNHRSDKEERDVNAVPELRRVREIYDENRLKRETGIREKQLGFMKAALQSFDESKLTLTREGDLPRALKAEQYREKLEKMIEHSIIPGDGPRHAEIGASYDFAPFEVGSKMFTNRNYVWTVVPEKFSGYSISVAPGGSKEQLTFTVKVPGLVTVVAELADADKLASEGWNDLGEVHRTPKVREISRVLQKQMPEGRHKLGTPQSFLGMRLLQPSEADGQ